MYCAIKIGGIGVRCYDYILKTSNLGLIGKMIKIYLYLVYFLETAGGFCAHQFNFVYNYTALGSTYLEM
jgi:hypothetical protein